MSFEICEGSNFPLLGGKKTFERLIKDKAKLQKNVVVEIKMSNTIRNILRFYVSSIISDVCWQTNGRRKI